MNFFLLLFICSVTCVYGDLHSVLLVYRHGDRTPTHFAPTDPFKSPKYWPAAPGELTNPGKLRQYNLGKWFRDRYHGFLPSNYQKKDIYVRSSATDRCMMSAAVNLAGLYPPTTEQIWGPLQWSPIPVHSVPVEEDGLLKMSWACPSHKPKFEELLKSSNFTEIDKNNEELYKFLSENLGKKIDSINDIESPYDTLELEAENKFQLQPWTEKVLSNGRKVFPDEMKIWADLSFQMPTYTTELAKLSTGRFFDTLGVQFQATINNDTEKLLAEKMVMFSAHKTTIASITHTLGVTKLAPFAGALIFELKKNPSSGKFYVNTLFKDENNVEQLQIGDCKVDCDFDEFLDIIKPFRLTEEQWESECLSAATTSIASTATLLAVVFSLVLNRFI